MKIKEINNLQDLQNAKKRMKKQVAKSEYKIQETFERIKEETTPDKIVNEISGYYGLDGNLINAALPLLFQLRGVLTKINVGKIIRNSPHKKLIITSLVATGLGVGGYYFYQWNKNRKTQKAEEE